MDLSIVPEHSFCVLRGLGQRPNKHETGGLRVTESACFRKVGTALHCLPLSCPRSYPRISPSTHTTIRTGRVGQIFGEMFCSRRKKAGFFNPFPKKIQGIHTKALNCGGVYGKIVVSNYTLSPGR